MLYLNDNDFDTTVEKFDRILVVFGAVWCPSCKTLEAELSKGENAIAVAKVDIDASPGLAIRYHIRSAPTLIVFKGGEVADIKTTGPHTKRAVLSWATEV